MDVDRAVVWGLALPAPGLRGSAVDLPHQPAKQPHLMPDASYTPGSQSMGVDGTRPQLIHTRASTGTEYNLRLRPQEDYVNGREGMISVNMSSARRSLIHICTTSKLLVWFEARFRDITRHAWLCTFARGGTGRTACISLGFSSSA